LAIFSARVASTRRFNVGLDDFERETLREGPGLAKFWKELNARSEQ
jgi:hypothetical protein